MECGGSIPMMSSFPELISYTAKVDFSKNFPGTNLHYTHIGRLYELYRQRFPCRGFSVNNNVFSSKAITCISDLCPINVQDELTYVSIESQILKIPKGPFSFEKLKNYNKANIGFTFLGILYQLIYDLPDCKEMRERLSIHNKNSIGCFLFCLGIYFLYLHDNGNGTFYLICDDDNLSKLLLIYNRSQLLLSVLPRGASEEGVRSFLTAQENMALSALKSISSDALTVGEKKYNRLFSKLMTMSSSIKLRVVLQVIKKIPASWVGNSIFVSEILENKGKYQVGIFNLTANETLTFALNNGKIVDVVKLNRKLKDKGITITNVCSLSVGSEAENKPVYQIHFTIHQVELNQEKEACIRLLSNDLIQILHCANGVFHRKDFGTYSFLNHHMIGCYALVYELYKGIIGAYPVAPATRDQEGIFSKYYSAALFATPSTLGVEMEQYLLKK